MLFPIQPNPLVATPLNTVALEANVQMVINAINTNSVIPYGDYGGSSVYYFQTSENALGNLVYTVFDRVSNIGLASFMVRFSTASTIRQVLFGQYPRSQVDLQFLILPYLPISTYHNTTIPQ
jgi:hypothetical protein